MKIKTFAIGNISFRDRVIKKVGFDTGVLVALIDNDLLLLSKPKLFIEKGICYAYQLVVNQTIGVLIHKRGYSLQDAKSKTLDYLRENNIEIIKEENIDLQERDRIFSELQLHRKKLNVKPLPEDTDLDILASYKIAEIDLIFTTNFKHFIELGKYLGIYIDGVYSEEQENQRDLNKMLRRIFWKPKYKKK